jgi:hypothetical protein
LLKKVVAYYKKKHKNVKNGIGTLSKIHIYPKMINKKLVIYWDNYKHLL